MEVADERYHKIDAVPEQIEAIRLRAIPRRSAEVVLDFDATDDPLHGSQEGVDWTQLRYGLLLRQYSVLRDCKGRQRWNGAIGQDRGSGQIANNCPWMILRGSP